MKRIALILALLVGAYLVSPADAQGRFWVLTNGALRYVGNVAITGATTSGASLTVTGADASGRAFISNGTGAMAFGTNPASSGTVLRVPNNTNMINARNAANSADLQTMFYDTNNLLNLDPQANGILYAAKTFAALGAPANGAFYYCSDCTIASPCAGSGTGAFAKRLNNIWVCN